MPARMACATERNLGFSSDFFRVVASCRVKVDANHSRTSGGTASGCTSDTFATATKPRMRKFTRSIATERQCSWQNAGPGWRRFVVDETLDVIVTAAVSVDEEENPFSCRWTNVGQWLTINTRLQSTALSSPASVPPLA
uniref:Uncharacterized protein n=1 Tax=Anopheles coluzzii TaxID=1518534 RepID=A0A8W7Q1F3_ANOCL